MVNSIREGGVKSTQSSLMAERNFQVVLEIINKVNWARLAAFRYFFLCVLTLAVPLVTNLNN